MLNIIIPEQEYYNDLKKEFVSIKETSLKLEHSLVSLSKWEQKWKIPFLTKVTKTEQQVNDYIKAMTITQNVDQNVYNVLSQLNMNQINDYIIDSMTATTFNDVDNHKINGEQITSELIYYWMIALGIPVEFQKWHINRLLTLIKVCNIKNSPKQKLGTQEILNRNRALNEARKKKLHTQG